MDKMVILCLLLPNSIFGTLLEGWNGPGPRMTRPGPVKTLPQGSLRGLVEFYDGGNSLVSYKGIPYAEPPVGELRWKAPQPAGSWRGIRDATLFGANCPQFGEPFIGTRQTFVMNEDCLFINVFTPNRPFLKLLPVFFQIHLGGFHGESGDPNLSGWEFFPQNGVIYVTFNYRLDVLGQLNTEDRHATGNYALKDILLALQWVNKNIEHFGGDKDNIILMGHSVGGQVAQLLILSEHARGLFSKAISMGGSIFHTFAFQPNPREKAEALGRGLNLEWRDTEDLVAQMREISAERLLNVTFNFLPTQMPTLFVPRTFIVSIDAEESDEVKLVPHHPDILVRNSTFNDVPFMIGFNSMESLSNMRFPNGRDRFNADPHLLIPDAWKIERNSSEAREILDGFRRVYFNGSEVITEDMMWQWTKFCNDRETSFGISKLVDFHYPQQPTYYYRFSYSGAFSFTKEIFGMMDYPGAASFEDIFYLNRFNRFRNPVPVTDHAYVVRARLLKLMINFGTFGNPTPATENILQNVIWPRVTDDLEFLDIDHDLRIDFHPSKERMDLWRDFDRRFNKF